MNGAPEVGQLETQDYIGVGDFIARPPGLVKGVARRKIHAAAHVHNRSLQCFGKFDEQGQAGCGACRPVDN